ncbi:MAG: cobamide remodeling phosphodiesterase CbiR [Anaerolineaceae bacterium]|nr:cobamide remodeling phosphodiesterase CbiR [Anaerolineaceae bacterium]
MKTDLAFPFRLGTTSYILPDEILPNVRFLAGQVQDVELVLFEVDDGPSNLPSAAEIAELNALAAEHGLSYTVHLPLDLRLGEGGSEQHVSLEKARRVIECTRPLSPWAYVLHLDGRRVQHGAGSAAYAEWVEQSRRALEITAAWAGEAGRLAVENLEGYPPDFWQPVLEGCAAGRCVDIGHLWRDHLDPLPWLAQALPRARVLHLHGVGQRDHQSLAFTPPQELDRLVAFLLRVESPPNGAFPCPEGYGGVVTLEVFNESDFRSSQAALLASLERVRQGR